MSLMEKLQFWKKKDDFGDLGDFGKHESLPPLKNDPMGGHQPLGSDPLSSGSNPLSQGRDPLAPSPDPLSDHSMDSHFVQPLTHPGQRGSSSGFNQSPSMHAPEMTSAFAPHQQNPNYPSISAGYVEEPKIPNHDADLLKKEMEVISSKLDYLKAAIETVNRRLENIENMNKYEYGQTDRRV